MDKGFVAQASITVNAGRKKVWKALVDPAAIRRYLFGTNVESAWRKGSPIIWRGVWEGKLYIDKGIILAITPGKALRYTHFSPLSGLPDVPENYHTVSIDLTEENNLTRVALTQDGNPTEAARDHSQKNWEAMLEGLKKTVEE
ncbi:MAG TPA: SRPBCC family protein [Chitinivibrionales bacterium]|nr:SRPBCC family protein [Chitinivibrionales bacterium]